MTETIKIPIEKASAELLAPFGKLIGKASQAELMSIDFYQGAVKASKPTAFHCEYPLDISLTSVEPRPCEVRYLERHFQHTQTFIPLGGKPFVVVMAPATEDEMPDLSAARAFQFDGSAALVMHVGTWHEFPFAVEPDTEIIVLLSNQTSFDLQNSDPVTKEAFGPDLDKKDIVTRAGTKLCFSIDSET